MSNWITLQTNVSHRPNTDDEILNTAHSIDLGTVDVHVNFDLVTDWYEFEGVIYIMQIGELEYKTFKGTTDHVNQQLKKNQIANYFKTS